MKLKSGFARKGVKDLGYEQLSQLQHDKRHLTVDGKKIFIFGSTSSAVRRWGFPGGTLGNGVIRALSPPTWDVFPDTYVTDTRQDLTNIGVMRKVDRNGILTVSERTEKVLQRTVAQELNIIRNKGVFKRFSFPDSSIKPFNWLMPTRYLRVEAYMKLHPGTAHFHGVGSNNSGYWDITVTGNSSYVHLTDMADRQELRKHWSISGRTKFALMHTARQRCISRIRRNDIELSVALAEGRKTLSHLAKTALDIFKIYRAVKRGDFKAVWRILGWQPSRREYSKQKKLFYATKLASQRWLELQYAWRPLLGDVNGAIETLMKDKRQQMTFKATGSNAEAINYTVDHFTENPSRTEYHSASGKAIAKCVVHYAVTSPIEVFMAELGLNPYLALWEVVPWSFVVDWFTNIGDFLETIDVGTGKEFISGTETFHTVLYRESRMPIQSIRFPVSPINPMGGFSGVTSHFLITDRRPLTTWPKVGAYIKNPLSTTHVLNAIALARTIRK